MLLEIDVFARYGIDGAFVLDLAAPINLGAQPDSKKQTLVKAQANVLPYASAGMSAFVGVGFDLGAISASIGIEGVLNLARVTAPIFAGVDLSRSTEHDVRPLPDDIKPPVSLLTDTFQFGLPKAFKFYVGYEYGAGLHLDNILGGEINARLRIKFFFFSRTWRKQVVKFNGWSYHFNLIQGSSDPGGSSTDTTVPTSPKTLGPQVETKNATTNVASGQATMGLSEPQVPLTRLARLELPANPPIADAGADVRYIGFDASSVQGMFYDNLCCSKTTCQGGPTGRPVCCPGYSCSAADAGVTGNCVADCRAYNQSCTSAADCCHPDAGPTITCTSYHLCQACLGEREACASNEDCCNHSCLSGQCETLK